MRGCRADSYGKFEIFTYKTDREFKEINEYITDDLLSALSGNEYERNTIKTPVSSNLKEIVANMDNLQYLGAKMERSVDEIRYGSLTGYYYRVNQRSTFYLLGSTDSQEKVIMLIPDSLNEEHFYDDAAIMSVQVIRGIDPSLDDNDASMIGRTIVSEDYTRNGVTYSFDPKSFTLTATYSEFF